MGVRYLTKYGFYLFSLISAGYTHIEPQILKPEVVTCCCLAVLCYWQ
jgi:hypothetical protein